MTTKRFEEYQGLDLQTIGKEILSFWDEAQIFEKSISSREGKPQFVFYEGPPSANGKPGIHHVMSRTIKDIFCRFATQEGKQVFRKAGWDTHGLPVELGVEKELGITKEDIGTKISIEDYNKACKEAVLKYTDIWNDLTHKMGYWVDMENPYITYKPKYMESVWWLLKELYNKKLMYKGYTIQPYSPKAGTGLSSHELNMPGAYRDITDTTIVAQFQMKTPADTNHALWKELQNFVQEDALEVEAEGCGGAFHWKEFTNESPNVYFLAWTTTPWTLPSNTALTVGPKIEYALVQTFNQYTFQAEYVILAKNLISKQFTKPYFISDEEVDFKNFSKDSKKIPYRVVKTFSGKEMVGIRYEQLVPWALPYEDEKNAFQIIDGDFVTTEDGTGIVHTAPTFGVDDAKVAKEHGVPPMLVLDEHENPIPLVDTQGKFIASIPEGFGGKYVKNEYYVSTPAPEKSVDVEIAIKLKTENKAFKVEKYKHSYPHCWRTDKPILYYPLDSWFIKVSDNRERLLELNDTINWKPKSTGEGRFGNWLKNANDWNLSRSRYWGIPLPIWRTEEGEEEVCIGSVAELFDAINTSIEAGIMKENPFEGFEKGNFEESNYDLIDLHKNVVDQIVLVSPSGKPMKRESDLIDVWFDSGAMPYAQLHYPFENEDQLAHLHPADFIAEGVDQTRGWFYTLHAISTLVFDKIAYKNVVSNGLVLDKEGQKMSKRLGNTVDPFETLKDYGPDATRWYMISNSNPWENLKFNLSGIDEVRKKFFGTLYNTYSFFSLYANVDGFQYAESKIPILERPETDQWIVSELNTLILEVQKAYTEYEPTRVTRLISIFVNDNLSNWYVRLNRRRFWKGEYTEDKIAAYQTLYECLVTIAQLMAPISPFYADRLYLDLNKVTGLEEFESVHLSHFPKADKSMIQKDLQEQTHLAQTLTSMIFSLRKKDNIKVRQPLQRVMIPVLNTQMQENIQNLESLLKQETNVKEIQTLDANEAADLIEKQIKPNFKTLGPRLGKDMKSVSQGIMNLSPTQIEALENEEEVMVEGYPIRLEDVEISAKDVPGWSVATNGKYTVALDIQINDALRAEGYARELVNRVQNLRKDQEFELTDTIVLEFENALPSLTEAIVENKKYICQEVLANDLIVKEQLEEGIEIEIEDQKTKINIFKN